MTRYELAIKAERLARALRSNDFDWHTAAEARDTALVLDKWTRIYLAEEPDVETQVAK